MKSLKIIPMGGLEEVGKNMIMVGYGDEYIIVDSGMAFPDENMLGVQCVIPNIDFLSENKDKIKGLLLTHAHEDHIGAIPYLLNVIDIPIYGTQLTLGILKNKLRHHKHKYKARFNVIDPKNFNLQMAGMNIEVFRTVHSIYDSIGYVFKTPVGNVVHMGDFKLDFSPIDGKGMDYSYLSNLADEGVKLLISDSTNASRSGMSNTELNVANELRNKMRLATGLTVVSTFSSSLPRVQSIVNIAKELNKKVAIAGVSMLNNVKAAVRFENITIDENIIVNVKNIKDYSRDEIVLITTGAQGETMAGLMRLANDENENIRLEKEDTIIFSSGVVPGNEKSVSVLVNKLLKKEVNVVRGEEIHTSGHGHKEDLKMAIDILKPKFLMPFHGEYSMLLDHKKIATEVGVPKDNVIMCSNGDELSLTEDGFSLKKSIFKEKELYVDRTEKGFVSSVVSRDRNIMSKSGVAVVNININNVEKEDVHVVIKLKGVAIKSDIAKISNDIKVFFIEEYLRTGKVQEAIRNNYGMIQGFSKAFQKRSGLRPMIIPFINT